MTRGGGAVFSVTRARARARKRARARTHVCKHTHTPRRPLGDDTAPAPGKAFRVGLGRRRARARVPVCECVLDSDGSDAPPRIIRAGRPATYARTRARAQTHTITITITISEGRPATCARKHARTRTHAQSEQYVPPPHCLRLALIRPGRRPGSVTGPARLGPGRRPGSDPAGPACNPGRRRPPAGPAYAESICFLTAPLACPIRVSVGEIKSTEEGRLEDCVCAYVRMESMHDSDTPHAWTRTPSPYMQDDARLGCRPG
jgi:hypothetical protein